MITIIITLIRTIEKHKYQVHKMPQVESFMTSVKESEKAFTVKVNFR